MTAANPPRIWRSPTDLISGRRGLPHRPGLQIAAQSLNFHPTGDGAGAGFGGGEGSFAFVLIIFLLAYIRVVPRGEQQGTPVRIFFQRHVATRSEFMAECCNRAGLSPR